MNLNDLKNTVAKHLIVAYEWKNPEAPLAEREIEIKESGHVQHGKTIRKAILQYFQDNHAEDISPIQDHCHMEFMDAIKRVPPVIWQFYVCGLVEHKTLMDSILNAPKDAEIIVNQVPEEKFVETLFQSYELMKEARAATPGVKIEGGITLPSLSKDSEKIVNSVFKGFGIPDYEAIASTIASVNVLASKSKDLQTLLDATAKAAKKEQESLLQTIQKLRDSYESAKFEGIETTASGDIPSGKVVMKKVNEVFKGITEADFMIPTWEWDGVHPEVPKADPFYIFREELLLRALFAIASNQRMYLQGHTGSGKTTLIEQIAAHLNWPFKRINFDSEITRMDLIGRDTLKDGESVFVDGMLPQMMQGPYIGVFDEIDFCRPDVAYVMQSVLEGNSFRITEDGGREIKPNPMFRMFATGNTVGQGDEHGMYQGARPQSLAFLDRFTIWGKVEYLKESDRKELIKRHYPMLSEEAVTIINKYATEHLAAFEGAKVLQPISPRGILAIANATTHFYNFYKDYNKAIKEALQMTILDRATTSDYAVIRGVIDRVVK